MAKHIGIWLDKRVAKIITLKDGDEKSIIVHSEVEEFHPKGGSGSRMKGGPQDVVQDSKYLEREKHQFKDYFEKITPHLAKADDLVVFGPSQTGRKFADELIHKHRDLHAKIKSVEVADSMTDNQIRAWVRDYFQKS